MKHLTTPFAILALAVYASASPDPKKILADSNAACKALKSIRYTVKAQFRGESATAEVSQVFAKVPDSGLMPGKYFLKGSASDGTQLEMGYDGKTFRIRKDGKIEYVDSPTAYELGQITPMTTLHVVMGFGSNVLAEDKKPPTLSYVKEEKIGQWTCDVIQVTRRVVDPAGSEVEIVYTIAYDQKSHLPIQHKSASSTKTVTKLLLNPKIDEGLFRLEGKEVPVDRHRASKLLEVGSMAPEFSLKDEQGKVRSLSDYKGKVVLLDFWATWCQPCLAGMPNLQALHTKYQSQGLEVIGVSIVEDPPSAPVFKSKGCTYQLLLDGAEVMKMYKGQMLPTLYIIDRQGKIAYRQAGISRDDKTELAEVVQTLLKR